VADRSLSGGRVTHELYAVSGSWLTWRVSRPLSATNGERYAREAELRCALGPHQRSAEDIPLHSGEPDESPANEP
jgi:putative ATP-binding cassette transporter